ncbi:MAG: carboxypeptidase regulatory-like domain-containing protein [bacterium]|nr:MAG: carboxypeptidase regulatory-like domain-containing protein [bacterium]
MKMRGCPRHLPAPAVGGAAGAGRTPDRTGIQGLARCPVPGAQAFIRAALCLAMAAPAPVLADSGIHGRIAWRGELVPDVVVYAYDSAAGDFLRDPVAVSEPSATDGTYRLALAPGQYTLVARSGPKGEGRPGVGDYYCYYSGSPVVVGRDSWTPVGFNLVKVPAQQRDKGSGSVIEGVVTYRDEPLERLYLYIYDKAGEAFRGPGTATIPVGGGGRFRVSVRPGKYYLIARKRQQGGMYGPMEIGDHFNYYPGNPVEVAQDERIGITLETVTRISQLEEGLTPGPALKGSVVDAHGRPVPGVRVFLHRPGELKGRPLYFSGPTGEDGRFELAVPVAGDYMVTARERFGGPAAEDEYSGRFGDEALHLEPEAGKAVRIVVGRGEKN